MPTPLSVGRGHKRHVCQDEALNFAIGVYPGVLAINKFGYNPSVGTSYEDIWHPSHVWAPLAGATELEVASTSTEDDAVAVGTGAWTFRLEGLNVSGEELIEDVILDGQDVVTTTGVFLHLNRGYVLTAGTGKTNAGIIYVADDTDTWVAGVPQTAGLIQMGVPASDGQSQIARYTVPTGYTAYVARAWGMTGLQRTATMRFMVETPAGVRRTQFIGTVSDGYFNHAYAVYPALEAGSTLLMQAKVDSSTAGVSGGFDVILVPVTP